MKYIYACKRCGEKYTTTQPVDSVYCNCAWKQIEVSLLETIDETPTGFDWNHPTVKRVIDRYTQLNRKSTPQDCEASRSVKEVAEYYAANYQGSFEFMIKMRGVMDNFKKLSPGQASGVINCMMNDYRFKLKDAEKAATAFKLETLPLPAPTFQSLASKPTNATERLLSVVCSKCDTQQLCHYNEALEPVCADVHGCAQRVTAERTKLVEPVVANGIYTIVLNEKGDYRTIKIATLENNPRRAKGTQVVSYLSASDNESDSSYTKFAYLTGAKIDQDDMRFTKGGLPLMALKVLVASDAEKRTDFGEAYALESKRCWRCNRLLTVGESIKRGLGPICAEKMGY